MLHVHSEEPSDKCSESAAQFGTDIAAASFLGLGPDPDVSAEDPSYDLMNAEATEEERCTRAIRESVEEIQPGDIVPLSATNCEVTAAKERTLVAGDIEPDASELTDRGGSPSGSCYVDALVFVDGEDTASTEGRSVLYSPGSRWKTWRGRPVSTRTRWKGPDTDYCSQLPVIADPVSGDDR